MFYILIYGHNSGYFGLISLIFIFLFALVRAIIIHFCSKIKCVMKKQIEIHKIDISTSLPLQYADEGIRAGFPSPAQDYMEQTIDLNKELIKHPASTFLGRVVGDSMRDEGIDEGDILVIDKSLELLDDDLAVCFVDGEFTVKRVHLDEEFAWLVPANPNYPKIKVTKDNDFIVWGIVTYTIKKTRHTKHFNE